MDRRTKGLLIGGVAGALLGVLTAWIIVGDSSHGGDTPAGAIEGFKKIQPGDVLKLLTASAVVIRQVADLRARPSV